MTSVSVEHIINLIKKEREKIWLSRPEDIRTLKRRLGAAKQNLTTLIYADNDTQSMEKYLYHLRQASKLDGMDLDTLRMLAIKQLEFDHRRADIYYQLNNFAKVLLQAIEALKGIRSVEDYRRLVEELIFYIGKLNFWIDLEIPWNKLSLIFGSHK